jgi:AraC-like DNA-binding protein
MPSHDARPTVLTIVPARERQRFDAAAVGYFIPVHASSVREAVRAVRERPINAVLVSPGSVPPESLGEVATIASSYGVPTVAVFCENDRALPQQLLEFGASGVRRSVDLSATDGWRQLRDLLAHPATPTAARILVRLLPALGDASMSCRLFFQWMVKAAPRTTSVRAMLRPLRVPASTFVSRFFRATLPSPKRYLASTRLLHAVALLEQPWLSVSDVAYRLDYSSPQSFGRHIRAHTGLTATAFRRRHGLDHALEMYDQELLRPFRPAFRIFRPFLSTETGTIGHADPDVRTEGT